MLFRSTPEEVFSVRPDAIVATGRSDYPNQVNNVLAFPYLFRGALDVRARRINMEMKIATANALAQLAREDVPDEVIAAYHGVQLKFGPNYIIPTPFDPRLLSYIPPFVAQAAMDSGVARVQIDDMDAYRNALRSRVDPSAALMQKINSAVRGGPNKRIVFAEGEEPAVIRAAWGFTVETATQAIRLVLSGVFTQYPRLKIIIGHLGEGLPFCMQRLNLHCEMDAAHRGLKKSPLAYLRENMLVTSSGNFSIPAFMCTYMEIEIGRAHV